eukprot:5244669-Pleurochrysis_carterae.AAC.3
MISAHYLRAHTCTRVLARASRQLRMSIRCMRTCMRLLARVQLLVLTCSRCRGGRNHSTDRITIDFHPWAGRAASLFLRGPSNPGELLARQLVRVTKVATSNPQCRFVAQ